MGKTNTASRNLVQLSFCNGRTEGYLKLEIGEESSAMGATLRCAKNKAPREPDESSAEHFFRDDHGCRATPMPLGLDPAVKGEPVTGGSAPVVVLIV
jgi:hypothetical protein